MIEYNQITSVTHRNIEIFIITEPSQLTIRHDDINKRARDMCQPSEL